MRDEEKMDTTAKARERLVSIAINRLAGLIERAESQVSEAVGTFQPVTRSPDTKGDDPTGASSGCELADHIQEMADKLERQVAILADLVERSEL